LFAAAMGVGCGSSASESSGDAASDAATAQDTSTGSEDHVAPSEDAGGPDASDATVDHEASAGDASGDGDASACVGLQCSAQMDDCAGQGKPLTTISGTVYDPAGALPLYDIYVYIPNAAVDPIVPGSPTCTACQAPPSGSPVLGAYTDADGHFTIQKGSGDPWGVPSGAAVPLVLQTGKWRRQVTVNVTACQANPIPDPTTPSEKLRLPAKSSEGDMPLMAFTSGCDPAECFLRQIGIDDSEFVAPGSPTGHVQFYTGQDSANGTGASAVTGGNTYADTYSWWTSSANLLKYDLIFNSCECDANDRGQGAYQAMHDYLAGGGRLFATHYYYNWFAPPTGPADFQSVVSWALPEQDGPPYGSFFIDTSVPKGKAYADWLQANGTTTTYGQLSVVDSRWDMNAVTPESTRWIYNANGNEAPDGSTYATMVATFDTPVGADAASQCGRAAFSDIHASGSSDDSTFPNECANADPDGSHAVNQKALEFMFFDLSSCIGD
jgi:hypothetical protein